LREPWAMWAPDGLAQGAKPSRTNRDAVPGRTKGGKKRATDGRLANTVLAHLPLGVVVIDADTRLVFWNEQAASLFGASPALAEDQPLLAEMLAATAGLNPQQRDRIVGFATTHVAAGDRTEPDSILRIVLDRDHRIALQIRGIGSRRWLIVIDQGRSGPASGLAGMGAADGIGDAWLDPLTGLSNRRLLNQVLHDLLDNAPSDLKHALLIIDLDRFKPINDVLGHSAGDALLCLVARRLRREIREDDLLVRLGGDEFVILIAGGDRAERLAARVVDVLSRPFLVSGQVANIGASVGIARLSGPGASADDVMRHADLALFEAKRAGRRTWRLFDPAMAAAAHARRELETDLRKALALGEMSVVYQAQLHVPTQTLTGFEALLRWNHPTRGAIPPSEFIPVAEEIGCIAALGAWVLKTACKDAAAWPAPLSVAVNVSPRQLEDCELFFEAVQSALRTANLAPTRLELEITESSLLSLGTSLLDTLERLRATGISLRHGRFWHRLFLAKPVAVVSFQQAQDRSEFHSRAGHRW
jgi:diguanylate cyclase (GGDEF)-like protein